jgi:hypothetical protein
MKNKVLLKSGARGYRCRLHENYADREEFVAYNGTYGLAQRLGYESADEAWEANPKIEGGTNPADFRKVPLKPWERNGTRYATGPNGERICTGSQMGRRDCLPEDTTTPQKLRLERLRFVDGDYDSGGAYWGSGPQGSALYCAYNGECEVFVRTYGRGSFATSRAAAKAKVRESLPAAKFYN